MEQQQVEDSFLETFLKAIVEKYYGDFSKPGVVLAWLPDSKEFYGSVVRYRSNVVEKTIVCDAKAPTASACIQALMEQWRLKLRPRTSNLEKFLDRTGPVTDAQLGVGQGG